MINIPEKYQTPNYEEYFVDPIKYVIKFEEEDDYIIYGNIASHYESEHGHRNCEQTFTALDGNYPISMFRSHEDTATGWTEFMVAMPTEKTITENGEYYPHERNGELFFNRVEVNVPTTELTGLTVTSNGTYTAPGGKAYNTVNVNVPSSEVGTITFGSDNLPSTWDSIFDETVEVNDYMPFKSVRYDNTRYFEISRSKGYDGYYEYISNPCECYRHKQFGQSYWGAWYSGH